MPESKYPNLRRVISWVRTIARIILAFTWIGGIIILLGFMLFSARGFGAGYFLGGILLFLVWLLSGYTLYVIMTAFAELFTVVGDIGDNSWIIKEKLESK